ncbi:MAG: LemA family protein [Lactococcus sp.]|uniref:LemA family protein n=1 Tax=Pseudolactococcus carnosus TaxID=2749961 RepID=UPI001FB8F876|nr:MULTISPECIES: LemA family protein [Lactococcus]MBR6896466.1 LemA family protein [Lactococcus sp.]MCJ2000879.1 LemA family protein [Lactococcus carnosus]MDN5409379.1 LemA family protein [Lactococcus sp.]MDN5412299.1 LemA family protein [Lactococcus sp.]MDN5436308.1 LemA family protein [Lactococcus sp.]
MEFIKKNSIVVGIIGVLVVIIIAFFSIGNGIVKEQNSVDSAFADIDTQLQRRNDLIPNLVSTVKGYAAHEEKIFTAISTAQSAMTKAETVTNKAAANDQVSSALNGLLRLQVSYPDIKADKQFTQLADELAGTENRIAVARTRYNDVVKTYNNKVTLFPTSIVAGMRGATKKDFFKASESAKNTPSVDFGNDKK